VQNCSFFREIDFVATKHRINSLPQLTLLGQPDQQLHGFAGDAILRVVNKEAKSLGSQALAALWIIREKQTQVGLSDFFIVSCEILPCLAF
jgi:hypothetical protein